MMTLHTLTTLNGIINIATHHETELRESGKMKMRIRKRTLKMERWRMDSGAIGIDTQFDCYVPIPLELISFSMRIRGVYVANDAKCSTLIRVRLTWYHRRYPIDF